MNNYKAGMELPKTGNVLLFAGAPWCSPCKTLKPTVEAVLNDLNVDGYYIDLDEHYLLANTLGISSVPTLVLIKDGSEVARHSGNANLTTIKALFKNGWGL